MASTPTDLDALVAQKYQHGFVTDVESDTLPPGLDEDVVRVISKIKREPQFMLDWRLQALRHWHTMANPDWAHLRIAPIDYQSISYYSAPRAKTDGPKSLDEVDPQAARDVREARRAAARAGASRRCRRRRRVRQRLGRDDVQGQAGQGRA